MINYRKTETIVGGRRQGKQNWQNVMTFLNNECQDIRMNICVGCGFAKLYNNNGDQFITRRGANVEEVLAMVNGIRKMNIEIKEFGRL